MDSIKHIITDFGGVLYRVDYKLTFDDFCKIMEQSKKPYLGEMSDFYNHRIYKEFEKGIITDIEFRNNFRSEFDIETNDNEIDNIMNKMLLGINYDSFDLFNNIKIKYPLTLLSNTNVIHFEHFYKQCQEILTLFDHTFFSHQLGMRKPDAEIFDYTIEKTGISRNHILFIDDSEENIKGARKSGLKTYLFDDKTKNEKLKEILSII